MASIGGDRERLIRTFLNRNKKSRKATPGSKTASFPKPGQDENAAYSRFSAKRKPPRLPSNINAQPAEDDYLFNPLVHGNRRMGNRNKGPVKRGR